nr:MAG TPA: hypothetical protein [Caudoviricetes sp.]
MELRSEAKAWSCNARYAKALNAMCGNGTVEI